MKYFTDELWRGINSESVEERESASTKWDNNLEEYCQIFEEIKKLLPKKFLKIYMEQEGFHDYNLKNFEIIHGEIGYRDPVAVSIVINNTEHTWNILYNKIKKIAINYEQESDICERKRKKYRGFDDYGYDEFFQIDEKTLSHEIIFASGATVLVYFQKISIVEIKNES